jgi:hypothetical protein
MKTKIVETPQEKHKVEIKEWITGRESEEIEAPITDVRFKVNMKGQGDAEINAGEAVRKSAENAVKIVVVSVDGATDDVLKRVLDMPKVDYKFVMGEVDKIVRGEGFTNP